MRTTSKPASRRSGSGNTLRGPILPRILLVAAASIGLLAPAAGQEPPTIRVRPPVDDLARQLELDPAYLRRPNLQPRRIHFRAAASRATVEVCVDVTNTGNADSTPTVVSLAVAVSNPRTLGGVSSQSLQLMLGAVSPASRPIELCGGYTVPNRTEDWDLHANAYVDSTGSVAESDEADNQRWRDCRLFSPNPGEYRTSLDAC